MRAWWTVSQNLSGVQRHSWLWTVAGTVALGVGFVTGSARLGWVGLAGLLVGAVLVLVREGGNVRSAYRGAYVKNAWLAVRVILICGGVFGIGWGMAGHLGLMSPGEATDLLLRSWHFGGIMAALLVVRQTARDLTRWSRTRDDSRREP